MVLLLIFQGMDGAGKDGAIKHVMRGLDRRRRRCIVRSTVGRRARDDCMWRCVKALPNADASAFSTVRTYEEVLVVRVHPELLEAQQLPRERITRHIWKQRFEDMRDIERHLCRNGTVIRKFFLHVSKAEQRRRFLARLDDRAKNWKFSGNDVAERRRWHDYMRAYTDVISATSTKYAP